jgi:hypothetical protein
MTVTTNVSVYGAQDAIKALKNVDPEARKQFTKDVKNIAKPITDPLKNSYPETILSGMVRDWNYRGRVIIQGYSRYAAFKGVGVSISTKKKSTSVISIRQRDPWGSIVEFAGTKTTNAFTRNLDLKLGKPGRLMWETAEGALVAVSKEMYDALEKVMSATNQKMVTK